MTPPDIMTPPENDLDAEIAALKNQVFTLLVALIVVSGTLTVFLYRQASLAGKDIAQDEQIASALTKNQNAIETFVSQLVDYSHKNPTFVPVLKKYGIVPPAGTPAPAAPKK